MLCVLVNNTHTQMRGAVHILLSVYFSQDYNSLEHHPLFTCFYLMNTQVG